MQEPKFDISIITVVFNGEKFLEPTIKSVLRQSFKNFEYIVVDGASKDATPEIINQFRNQIDKFVSEPDRGVYDAMNKGLNMAEGEYVLFLNAGDELASSDTLERIFSHHNKADLIYGETNILNSIRKVIGTRTNLTSRKLPQHLQKSDFLQGQVVSHQSFIPKRMLCSFFDLKYQCSADIDWMLQVMSKAEHIHKSDQPISNYLQGGISDRQLLRCWVERFQILIKHFNPLRVILAHFSFVWRFLKIGAYKSE